MAANRAQPRTSVASGTSRRSRVQLGDVLVGKYRVERVIGEGGMGIVVAARHEFLDQVVAIKLLYGDDPDAQSRLLLEARACARLQSDHVARVMDVDSGPDGRPFVVMELLDGVDLCRFLEQYGPLHSALAVDYILQALEGLAHAHVRGMVHRDLKPSNLFLVERPDGAQLIKILDFGISKTNDVLETSLERLRAAASSGHTTVVGSPPYMSPEQVQSPRAVDHRTDIWSLGVCLYELVTRSLPFAGEMQDLFADIVSNGPRPLRPPEGSEGIPAGLETVILRCLAKDPSARFGDVAELAAALAPFGSGAWPGAAERVAATLERGFEASGSNRAVELLLDGDRLAIPGAPRAPESSQELVATATTVVRRQARPRSRALWLVGTPALLGLIVAGGAVYRAAQASNEEVAGGVPSVGLAAEPVAPKAVGVPHAAPVVAAPTSAPQVAAPAVSTAPRAHAPQVTSDGPSTSETRAAKKVGPTPSPAALPPGLPRERR